MNHYAIHQNTFAACEEMMGNAAATAAAVSCRSMEMKETVICPKPRRLGFLHTTLADQPSNARPLRWHASHQQEVFDSKAGNELLDIILAKDTDQLVPQVVSSPPFFCGSPPSRASNPLIQDSRFRDEGCAMVSPRVIETPSSPAHSPSSGRKGGRIRANFGSNPTVRVEGFDCLDRDRRNCSIPALA